MLGYYSYRYYTHRKLRPALPAPRMSMMSRSQAWPTPPSNTDLTSPPGPAPWRPAGLATTVSPTLPRQSCLPCCSEATTPRPPPRLSTYQTTENRSCLRQPRPTRSDPSSLTLVSPAPRPLQYLVPRTDRTTLIYIKQQIINVPYIFP